MLCPVCKHDVQPSHVLGGADDGAGMSTGFSIGFHAKCPRSECGAVIPNPPPSKVVSVPIDAEIANWVRELSALRHATQLTVEQAQLRAHGEVQLGRLKALKAEQEAPKLQVPEPVFIQTTPGVIQKMPVVSDEPEDEFVADLRRQLAAVEKQARRLRAMIAAAETV